MRRRGQFRSPVHRHRPRPTGIPRKLFQQRCTVPPSNEAGTACSRRRTGRHVRSRCCPGGLERAHQHARLRATRGAGGFGFKRASHFSAVSGAICPALERCISRGPQRFCRRWGRNAGPTSCGWYRTTIDTSRRWRAVGKEGVVNFGLHVLLQGDSFFR
jgi:hypothetical protein